jgi:dolichol-phosphate mannosyltransferase
MINYSISILIPTFNEALNITLLIEEIQKYIDLSNDEIIVIDDNSPDFTHLIVKELLSKYPNLKLVHRTNEAGLTSAINEGIAQSSKDLVLWMDADFSMHPKYIPFFIKEMAENEICIGSRYIQDAKDKRNLLLHVLLSKIINFICYYFLSNKITDWTSGFVCAKRTIFDSIKLEGDYGEYCINFLYKVLTRNLKIKEIPYICQDRLYGYSKTANSIFGFYKRGIKYLHSIYKLKFYL